MEQQKDKKQKRKELITKLKDKYRLVIMNDDTFAEVTSLRLSPLNVFVLAGSVVLFLIIGTIYLIAFTPLREYIPGYADVSMRRNMIQLTMKSDSLEKEIKARDVYFENLKKVITGDIKPDKPDNPKDTTNKYQGVTSKPSEAEANFRKDFESEDKTYSLRMTDGLTQRNDISSFFFFVPLNGMVTTSFNEKESHFGVDVASKSNEAVKSTLDGTVIMSGWTSENGHVVQVQHSNNLISIYKHNAALLKKAGDRVSAGEVIAIVGNSGELTSGPHLHFELWYNGTPVNPQDYINF